MWYCWWCAWFCTWGKTGKEDVYKRQVFGDGLLHAEVLEVVEEGNRLIQFHYEGIWEEVLDRLGEMPLPPYICLLYTSRCV